MTASALRVRTATAVGPATAIADPARLPLERRQDFIDLTDAENECEHGHLPLDRNPACHCWTPGKVRALLAQEPLADPDPFDRAAAGDIAFPKPERQSADTGQDLDEQLAHKIHDWYMDGERTMSLAACHFDLPPRRVRELFRTHRLPLREPTRGFRRDKRLIIQQDDPRRRQEVA